MKKTWLLGASLLGLLAGGCATVSVSTPSATPADGADPTTPGWRYALVIDASSSASTCSDAYPTKFRDPLLCSCS